MLNKKRLGAGLAILASAVLLTGCDGLSDGWDRLTGWMDDSDREVDITAMSAEELADYLVLETNSYRFEQEAQEGGTARDRMTQDGIQAACSFEGAPDSDTAGEVIAMARESYQEPPGGPRLGNWRRGAELARSGFGYRLGHNNDDHSQREVGGNCYACHQMDPSEELYGTLGPSLAGYGSTRGSDSAVVNYVHQVVSNPHQYFPCTIMPRFGRNNFLDEEQIAHIMAYLLDPDSPVNQ